MTMRLKEEGAAQVKASTDRLGKSFDATTAKAKAYDLTLGSLKGALSGLVSTFAVATVFQKIITETVDAEYATAQLNAALVSTKGAAGQSATALNAHAQALSYMTSYDDDAITGAQALLLTFTKIQGDVFPKATAAILDMAAAMNTDLKSATMQVGKALNDPILGVSALGRAGVQFSEAQKELIASLTETGRVAEAQAVILAELKTQFEGSAAAAANTLGGALKKLSNELGNLLTLSGDNSKTTVGFINGLTSAIIGLRVALDDLVGSSKLVVDMFRILGQMAYKAYGPIADVVMLLVRKGKEEQESAKALAESNANANKAYQSVLADAFNGYRTRQTEIAQLIKLSEVKALNGSQTKILRGEAARLTKEMNQQNLSMEGQYQIGLKLAEVQKALGPKKSALKLAEVSELGTAYFERLPLAMMPFDPIAALQGGAPRDDPSKKAAYEKEKELEFRLNVEKRRKFMIDETTQMANDVRDSLANTLGDALATGIQAAFAKGANFGDAMKAFGVAVLGGIGNLMVTLGQRLVQLGTMMKFAMDSFARNHPGGMIVAGLAMIAVGAALRGAASRAMDQTGFGGGGGGGGGGYSASATSGNMTMPTSYYGPTSAGSANTIERINPISVTIIGPNDPTAQRQMQELLRNAQRRGNV